MATDDQARPIPGVPYDTRDADRSARHARARRLLADYNGSPSDQQDRRADLLDRLLASRGDGAWVEPPFFCDYGDHIAIGARSFLNMNCVLLDGAPITIGEDVLIGPATQLLAVSHPMAAQDRIAAASGAAPYVTLAAPIRIGDRVWIGGACVICAGVTIGDEAVVGAGSVVTRSIPPGVFAAGAPARIVRSL